MYKTLIASILIGISLTGGIAHSQERWQIPEFQTFGEPACPDDETAVRNLIETYIKVWHDQNTPAVMALHSESTEWINAYARIFRDKDALSYFLETRLFPAFPKSASESEAGNMKLISIRYVGKEAAVLHLYTDGSRGPSVNNPEDLRRTHLHFVLEKQAQGEWKIVHTVIMDARA